MTTSQKVEFIDKYYGSLLGAVVGDAIGWPQEDRSGKVGKPNKPSKQLQNWIRKNGNRYFSYEEIINQGSYSDDSQLIFATARALKQANWFSYFVKLELPVWPLYERGGGGATKRAAQKWAHGIPPWKLEEQKREDIKRYFNAGGNGVVMRILPHVYYNLKKPEEMTQQVFLNGITTHGHPRALLSSILYAWALRYLINKEGSLGYGELVDHLLSEKNNWSVFPEVKNNFDGWLESAKINTNNRYMDLWEETFKELVEGLQVIKEALNNGVLDKTNSTLEKLNCFKKGIRGAGTVACLVSIYIASKYAAEPASGIVRIAFAENSDTDTNASLVGGLLGAIHGTEWVISDWYKVQDFDYIKKIVNDFYNDKSEANPIHWNPNEKSKFLDDLELAKKDEKFTLGPFKNVNLVDVKSNKPITKNCNSTTYKLLSTEGQTLYIKINKKLVINDENKAKNENKNSKVKENSFSLEKLYEVIPPRLTAKRLFKTIRNISAELETKKININDPGEVKEFSSKFVEKGIDDNLVSHLVHFVISNNIK